MTDRKQALEALRDKVKAGKFRPTWSELNNAGIAMNSHGQNRAGFAWDAYNGSLDAAKALHDAVLPVWRVSHAWGSGDKWVWNLTKSNPDQPDYSAGECENPARAWILAILEALISETPKGETP